MHWASSIYAYPLYVKIENPRAHSLFVGSESEKTTVEIPTKGSHEFKICGVSDWRVRYYSGVKGYLTCNLDKELKVFVETLCQQSIGDNWDKLKTVKYCTLRLDEIQNGFGPAIYTLSVAEVRDLGIPYDSDACKLTANELAMKVNPQSPACPLISQNALAAATCLLAGIKPAGAK
jgi:hypothetical protein